MTLYIYRVGGLAPQKILLQDLNLLKALVVLGLCLDRSDPPVRPTGQTGRSCQTSYSTWTGQTAWSTVGRARLATAPGPVRPLGQTGRTGWHSLLPILVVNRLLVYSLFMRVACSVCVTLPLIILYIYHLPSQWSSSCSYVSWLCN